jgi:acid phosphatase (class A)
MLCSSKSASSAQDEPVDPATRGGSLMLGLGSLAVATFATLAAGCESKPLRTPEAQPAAQSVPALKADFLQGYLPAGAAPDSLSLLPPPPAPGSAAQARDDEAAKAALALRGTPRWQQATEDADLRSAKAVETFACAVDVPINETDTPRLYVLLRRTIADDGLATYPTKNKYQRARPFTVNASAICTPKEEAFLRTNGSYPSGHSAVGWGWALILTEIAPERADAILARGRSFGDSRVVCNVHWLSDVEEGRVIASATVAKLHSRADFRADLQAAGAEIAAARAKGLHPARDCAKEDASLAAQ